MTTVDDSHPEVLPGEPDFDVAVKQQAVTAVKWSAVSRTLVQLIQFAGQVWLARLLMPSDFGLAAIVTVISNLALLVSDLGLGASLVHTKELTQKKLDTAFWLNALVGVICTLIVAAFAYPLASLYRHTELVGLFFVAALTYSVSLTVVPLALMERQMNLKPAAVSELLAMLGGVGGGVAAAMLGAGPYAVVIVPLINVALLSVFYAISTRYFPRGFIGRAELREIWAFGRGLTGSNLVNYFTRNSDELLLGRFASAAALGFYSRAFMIMLLPVNQIQGIIGRVLFPALTRFRDDRSKLTAAHRSSLVVSAAICAPIAAGAAACSNDFVLTFFGQSWAPMIPMMAILSSTGVQQVFQGTVGTVFQVTGRTDLMFKWNFIFAVLTVIAFVIGVQWGAIGMCCAVAIRGWALLPITLYVPLRLIGDTVRATCRALFPLACALVLEAAAAVAVYFLARTVIGSPGIRLVLEVIAGGLVYFLAMGLFDRKTLAEIGGFAHPGLRQRLLPRSGAHRADPAGA